MTLHQKTLGIICTTMLVLVALLYTSFQPFVVRSLNQLEEKNTIRNVERVLEALSDKISRLDMMAYDWSHWDDTYAFILDANQEFVKTNLVDSTFSGLGLNLLLMLDTSGKIIYGRGFDLETAEQKSIPEGILQHVYQNGNRDY